MPITRGVDSDARSRYEADRTHHDFDCFDAVAAVATIIEIRFKVSVLIILKRKELKTKDQMRRGSRRKTSPDSALQFSMTTVEEQGILESFSKLPHRSQLKFGPQQVGVIRLPVPFGPKKVKERRNFFCRSTS